MYRNPGYISLLLLLALLTQSCSTTLQSSWRDFNAYFNTYYNAKTSFERGLEIQERQEQPINPERPIRVHTAPRSAGQSDFEHAIQKSADVIRFHPQSRWVDNAIEIIGMSYYYQQQYFSADQKFVELLSTTSDPQLQKRAILWRGRAALELENYVEGINYAQSRLFSTEFDWEPEIAAELKLVIAQLYVAREEYEDAEVYLAESLPDIEDRRLEMRAYFLHGQLLEILERYDEAFEAYYRATHQSNPNYDLIYYAELKLGIVARERGDIDWAYDHFVSMSRDDRHFEYITAIEYEIGRTLQVQDRFTEARRMYEHILQRRTQNPSREVQAKVYYGIAELYRDYYTDYPMAAAYFDSSATQATNREHLPRDFDADVMARSYGDYTRLQNEIDHLDSLLWLAGLSQAELDSVVAEIRERRIAEMEEEARDRQRSQMISMDGIDEAGMQADEETDYGFLNYKNPGAMQRMSQAFQAYWGQRPLVDDWRRMEMVRVNIVRQFEEEGEEVDDVDEAIEQAVAPQAQAMDVDLSEIPFTEEEQRETRRMIASYEYEMGNVFYTSLAEPDSAARYYRSVMSRFPDSELAPQAIYSLSELYQSAGDSVNALQYAMQLVDFYPNTIYAERMANRYALDREYSEMAISREDSIALAYDSIKTMNRSVDRAAKLRAFAMQHADEEIAAEALFRSVLDYIETAREDELYTYRMNDLHLTRYVWEQEKAEREVLRDSVRAMLADSSYMAYFYQPRFEVVPEDDPDPVDVILDQDPETVTETRETGGDEAALMENNIRQEDTDSVETDADAREQPVPAGRESDDEMNGDDVTAEREDSFGDDTEAEQPETVNIIVKLYQDIAEQMMEEPDFGELFPYEGALWDSARVALLALQENHSEFKKTGVVDALADEIEVDRIQHLMVDTSQVYPCEELDERPQVTGGNNGFLEDSGLQQVIDAQTLDMEVVLAVELDPEGVPLGVEVRGGDDEPGIMESLRRNALEHMRFDPPTVYGVGVKAACEYTLELRHNAP